MTQATKTNKGRGGPKTAAGKKIVSANARKASIFTQGYLPDEDVSGKQERLQAMADQWQAHDPSRQLLLLTVEQAGLGIERMMKAERMKIEGIMASVNFSREFCVRAGISVSLAAQLPDWYFSEDAGALKQKQRALKLPIVWKQAENLKSNYSDGLMSRVHEHSPELYDYVSEGFRAGHSFSTMLGSRYEQSTTLLNLACLMNEINQNQDHFRWAEHPKRYQKIIDGLKAEKILEALDLEKSSRYATNFQNRILKAFAGLAAIDQHEAHLDQTERVLVEYQSDDELEPEESQSESESKSDLDSESKVDTGANSDSSSPSVSDSKT
jgi:hypothetical protein